MGWNHQVDKKTLCLLNAVVFPTSKLAATGTLDCALVKYSDITLYNPNIRSL